MSNRSAPIPRCSPSCPRAATAAWVRASLIATNSTAGPRIVNAASPSGSGSNSTRRFDAVTADRATAVPGCRRSRTRRSRSANRPGVPVMTMFAASRSKSARASASKPDGLLDQDVHRPPRRPPTEHNDTPETICADASTASTPPTTAQPSPTSPASSTDCGPHCRSSLRLRPDVSVSARTRPLSLRCRVGWRNTPSAALLRQVAATRQWSLPTCGPIAVGDGDAISRRRRSGVEVCAHVLHGQNNLESDALLHNCFNCYFPVSGAPRAFRKHGHLLPLTLGGMNFHSTFKDEFSNYSQGIRDWRYCFNSAAGHIDGHGSHMYFTFTDQRNGQHTLTVHGYVARDFQAHPKSRTLRGPWQLG